MAAKTYIPTLVFWAHFGHKYATRWQDKLTASLTTEQIACLTAWISATATLLACITKPAVLP